MSSTPSRLLLVEDNEPSRRHLAKILELGGYVVEGCRDGREALDALGRAPAPAIVLTDLMLPDLDGRDILRAAAALSPRPFLGLITGWDLDDEPELRAGGQLDRVYPKPIDVRGLLGSLPGSAP